jgi:hypothetical protein
MDYQVPQHDPRRPPAFSFLTKFRSPQKATHQFQTIDPSKITVNRFTRMKTAELFTEGIIEVEPPGVVGELHQYCVMNAGCSTSVSFFDGERKMICFPVQQTGSFKPEAAFFDGLIMHICSSNDAPPQVILNWRVVRG